MYRGGAPGNRECDTSIDYINRMINELDQASLTASHQMRPRSDVGGSLQNFQEQTLSSARQLLEHMDPIRMAAKGETENLAHLVSSLFLYHTYLAKYTVWVLWFQINTAADFTHNINACVPDVISAVLANWHEIK